ncbi:MAG: hypothetical protein GF416_01620 [Candidatus Altiarchaeales archaeon]|nr:hypothetical protein [Candidatus Altiarchaeales archaeon]MBD3415814.1 hypothetical protein [Candidatus Altiarchaeales archaeon]
MDEEEEFNPEEDGEVRKEHLLALIIQVSEISDYAAAQKMDLPLELVRKWMDELSADGLIEIDEVFSDKFAKISPEGLKKAKEAKEEWIRRQEEEEKPPEKPKQDPKKVVEELQPKIKDLAKDTVSTTKRNWADLMFLLALLLSLFMLKLFIDNPSMEVLSFFLFALMMSVVFVFYSQYQRQMKTRKVIGFAQWMIEWVEKRKNYVASVITAIFLIYIAIMLFIYPEHKAILFLLAVIVASTGMVIFYPKKEPREILAFYGGVALLTLGLMLVMDWLSPTQFFFGSRVRMLDFGVGVGLLLIVHLNEDIFEIRKKLTWVGDAITRERQRSL